jgi:hypothetical protein
MHRRRLPPPAKRRRKTATSKLRIPGCRAPLPQACIRRRMQCHGAHAFHSPMGPRHLTPRRWPWSGHTRILQAMVMAAYSNRCGRTSVCPHQRSLEYVLASRPWSGDDCILLVIVHCCVPTPCPDPQCHIAYPAPCFGAPRHLASMGLRLWPWSGHTRSIFRAMDMAVNPTNPHKCGRTRACQYRREFAYVLAHRPWSGDMFVSKCIMFVTVSVHPPAFQCHLAYITPCSGFGFQCHYADIEAFPGQGGQRHAPRAGGTLLRYAACLTSLAVMTTHSMKTQSTGKTRLPRELARVLDGRLRCVLVFGHECLRPCSGQTSVLAPLAGMPHAPPADEAPSKFCTPLAGFTQVLSTPPQ